ncbi:MAG: Ig-like domain-containing protein [Lachnospiraceae bacterium]|nr:Ig-like domain-containing protein [Lachnospiraceae bacterium]
MKNRRHNGKRKRSMWKYLVMMVLICLGTIIGLLGDSSQAADVSISWNGEILAPGTVYELKSSSMQLQLETGGVAYDDPALYEVRWTIEDDQQRDVIASISQGSSQTTGILRALSPGEVTVTVTIYDRTGDGSLALLASATCNIRVVFSIDTTGDDSIYKFVNEGDTDRSLVLYADSNPVSLGLNFGDADKTQWTSNNTEVVTVTQREGVVTPVGAGKTQVVATYTPNTEGGNTYTAYLDVYVIPKVSLTDGMDYETSLDAQMSSGDYLYTDTDFSNNLEVVRSKIIWVIKKDDGAGNSVVIANSLGMESDLITLTPSASRSNQLQLTGMAGEYDIYFYTYGSYFSEDNCTTAYTPSVVHLTIKSQIEDREEILSIGDSYNFAEAYNMTTKDFLDAFTVQVTTVGGGAADNYATYNPSTGVLQALAEGRVVAKLTVKPGMQGYVKRLMGLNVDDPLPDFFTTTIDIVDRIYLDRSNLTISLGQTYQLNLVLNNTYSGGVVWSSSDDRYVTVDETGLIKGVKITQSDVIITATVDAGNGVYKTASCIVKVEAAVDNFTINPNTPQTMLPGEHLTVVANIRQTVTVAPLVWMSSNTSVFTVETAADGKSAILTAVGGGVATLTVFNPVNEQYQTLEITVRVPISDISFAKPEIDVGLYKGGYNMRSEVTYAPKNATDTTLTWSSSDTSVAVVDSDGYITFKGPGTTLISVYPAYNPYNVMASCILTVIGTPEKMILSETDVTLDVKESKTLEIDFEPKNSITELTFTPNEAGLVTINYDETRQIITLVGQKPGSTNINIVSTEGLILNLKVTVKQPADEITLAPKEQVIKTGDSINLTPTLKPANATDTLVWESDNTSVAKVDSNGRVTGVKAGDTWIRVTTYHGTKKNQITQVHIIVRDGVKGVSLDSYEKTVEVDSSITITPIFNPATAYNKEMTWTVANAGIAKVEKAGTSVSNARVTGVKPGTTLVTGTTADGGYSASCLVTVTAKPGVNDTKVTVSPDTKYLAVGKSFYVKATVTGTSNKKVKWSTSKKKVATVTSGGKVKGKKIGTAYITAKAQDGSGAYARCKVQVVKKVKKLKLNKYSAKMLVGSTMKLKATVSPKNATIKSVKWTSSDKTIATVNSSGRVMGLAEGLVKIKAKTKDGSGKSATCIVTVTEPVEATGVSVAESEITVAKGRSIQSGITVSPSNSTTKISYHSDNPEVATVDKRGKIRTHRAGQATIYGETANGQVGYCEVLVVDLNRKGIVMRQYDTEQLHVNMIDDGVTWYSKNINIATVSPTGLVTGRRKGTTIIYANINGVKLGCRVRIKKIK